MLVQAFTKAELNGCRLVLAGPTPEPDYLARLKRVIADGRWKIEDGSTSPRPSQRFSVSEFQHFGSDAPVLLTGPLSGEEKLAAFAAADLFVLPSLSESFGNAAAEAVAAGVPVLLTDTCGIAPMIHRRAGFAVPLGTGSIATGLRIMTSRDRTQHVQEQKQVMRELSWDEPVSQT